jgi:hypothetical protein
MNTEAKTKRRVGVGWEGDVAFDVDVYRGAAAMGNEYIRIMSGAYQDDLKTKSFRGRAEEKVADILGFWATLQEYKKQKPLKIFVGDDARILFEAVPKGKSIEDDLARHERDYLAKCSYWKLPLVEKMQTRDPLKDTPFEIWKHKMYPKRDRFSVGMKQPVKVVYL